MHKLNQIANEETNRIFAELNEILFWLVLLGSVLLFTGVLQVYIKKHRAQVLDGFSMIPFYFGMFLVVGSFTITLFHKYARNYLDGMIGLGILFLLGKIWTDPSVKFYRVKFHLWMRNDKDTTERYLRINGRTK